MGEEIFALLKENPACATKNCGANRQNRPSAPQRNEPKLLHDVENVHKPQGEIALSVHVEIHRPGFQGLAVLPAVGEHQFLLALLQGTEAGGILTRAAAYG